MLLSIVVWFVATLLGGLRSSSWGDSVLPGLIVLFLALWFASHIARNLIAARSSSVRTSMLLQYAACYFGGLLYRLLFPLADAPNIPGPVGLVLGLPLAWGLLGAAWFAAWSVLLPLAFVFALQFLEERRTSRQLAAQQAHRADGVS